jgi:hypothetical protein
VDPLIPDPLAVCFSQPPVDQWRSGIPFPESDDDADSFVGQGADGGLVFETGGAFHAAKGGRPGAPCAGLVGELVKSLPQEREAGEAFLDVALIGPASPADNGATNPQPSSTHRAAQPALRHCGNWRRIVSDGR